jgi:hypothetical protein
MLPGQPHILQKNIAPCQSKFLVNFIGLVLTASMN